MAKINLTEALAKVLKKIVEEGAYPSPYHPLIPQRSPSRPAPSTWPDEDDDIDVMEPEVAPDIDVEPEVEPEEENPLAPPDEDVEERPKARHYRGIKETNQAWAKKIADKLNSEK
jgi:hypothetical protein